jgi:hypothetical protein
VDKEKHTETDEGFDKPISCRCMNISWILLAGSSGVVWSARVSHYYIIFNGGGQKRFIEAGSSTASELRSRLIVALTEAVGQPPRLMVLSEAGA